MKWLKRIAVVILGLLVLSVAVLLAMGQRPDAGRMHAIQDIHATPEQVWPWINESDRLKQWVSWLVEIEADPSQPRGVGHKAVWTMRDEHNGGRLMKITGVCTEFVPMQKLRVAISTPGMFDGDQTYRLNYLSDGRTRLEVEAQYRFGMWLAKLFEPLIMPSAKKKLAGDLARLKSLVEGAPQSATR